MAAAAVANLPYLRTEPELLRLEELKLVDVVFSFNVPVDNNAIAIDGLEQQDPTEGPAAVPTAEPNASPKKAKSPSKKVAPLKTEMAAQNSCARKAPEKYVPTMKGNKYVIALTQITSLLQGSKDALCMVQRLVKLMGKGLH